jgi:hypothetical protein
MTVRVGKISAITAVIGVAGLPQRLGSGGQCLGKDFLDLST